MKCATTTLHEQLALQPHVFMSQPKEPNFFSDDEIYARGFDWYCSLFEPAEPGMICGESSTHYAKLPDYPETVGRMARHVPAIKLIYVMRHPVDRLISHYVHEVTTGRITVGIHEAIERYPELIDYGRYSMQLAPYLKTFGPENVLPVFFDRLVGSSHEEMERIGRFLGHRFELRWDETLKPMNVGSERLRRSVLREILVRAPVLTTIRRRVVPKPLSESIKSLWRARTDRPCPSPELMSRLHEIFDEDLATLGRWLGAPLDCEHFHMIAECESLEWRREAGRTS